MHQLYNDKQVLNYLSFALCTKRIKSNSCKRKTEISIESTSISFYRIRATKYYTCLLGSPINNSLFNSTHEFPWTRYKHGLECPSFGYLLSISFLIYIKKKWKKNHLRILSFLCNYEKIKICKLPDKRR